MAKPTALPELALGLTAGSIGETSTVLILLGGAYLTVLRIVNWRIPVAIFAMVGGTSALLHAIDPDRFPDAMFMLLSGGLMLGAVFVATDMIASPLTRGGAWLYGALIGALTLDNPIVGGPARRGHVRHFDRQRCRASHRPLDPAKTLRHPAGRCEPRPRRLTPMMWPMYRTLVGAAIISAALLATTFETTREPILAQQTRRPVASGVQRAA